MRGVSRIRASTLQTNIPSENSFPVTFAFLSKSLRESHRNGSWITISSTERALYRCALWIAKARGCIVNKSLVAQILGISRHLLGSIRSRITAAGKQRARSMADTYGNRRGVFWWAPQVKKWLHDAAYIFYLGVNSQP